MTDILNKVQMIEITLHCENGTHLFFVVCGSTVFLKVRFRVAAAFPECFHLFFRYVAPNGTGHFSASEHLNSSSSTTKSSLVIFDSFFSFLFLSSKASLVKLSSKKDLVILRRNFAETKFSRLDF